MKSQIKFDENYFSNMLSYVIPIVFLFVVVLQINVNVMPITEGWWENYAWLSKTKKIYIDFNLSLPPLYVNLVSCLLTYTDRLINIRYVLMIFYFCNVVLLFYLCSLFVDNKTAVIGVLISQSLLIIKNPVWLSKDYHTLVSMVTIVFAIFICKIIKSKNIKYIDICSVGLVVATSVLIKQNIAFVLNLSFICTIILIDTKNIYSRIKYFLVYIISASVFLILYSHINGYAWIGVYLNNDSKGSSSTVLLRILENKEIASTVFKSILLALAAAFLLKNKTIERYIRIFKIKLIQFAFSSENQNAFKYLIATLLVFVLLNSNIFVITIAFFIYHLIDYKNKYSYIMGMFSITLLYIAYAGTMTAGFNHVSMEILTAIFSSSLISKLLSEFKINKNILIYITVSICAMLFYSKKIKHDSYNWWGYNVEGIKKATYISQNSKLEGIHLDKNTYEILNAADAYIKKLDIDETFFAYPNIPLFYWLFNKTPMFKNSVQWFDVFPTKDLSNLMLELKANKPKLIFWLMPPQFVYEGHKKIKKSELPMEVIDDYINKQKSLGNYIIKKIIVIESNDNESDRYDRYNFILNSDKQNIVNKYLELRQITDYQMYPVDIGKNFYSLSFHDKKDYVNFLDTVGTIPINYDKFHFVILERVEN